MKTFGNNLDIERTFAEAFDPKFQRVQHQSSKRTTNLQKTRPNQIAIKTHLELGIKWKIVKIDEFYRNFIS